MALPIALLAATHDGEDREHEHHRPEADQDEADDERDRAGVPERRNDDVGDEQDDACDGASDRRRHRNSPLGLIALLARAHVVLRDARLGVGIAAVGLGSALGRGATLYPLARFGSAVSLEIIVLFGWACVLVVCCPVPQVPAGRLRKRARRKRTIGETR
jgi:hypothetical protein